MEVSYLYTEQLTVLYLPNFTVFKLKIMHVHIDSSTVIKKLYKLLDTQINWMETSLIGKALDFGSR